MRARTTFAARRAGPRAAATWRAAARPSFLCATWWRAAALAASTRAGARGRPTRRKPPRRRASATAAASARAIDAWERAGQERTCVTALSAARHYPSRRPRWQDGRLLLRAERVPTCGRGGRAPRGGQRLGRGDAQGCWPVRFRARERSGQGRRRRRRACPESKAGGRVASSQRGARHAMMRGCASRDRRRRCLAHCDCHHRGRCRLTTPIDAQGLVIVGDAAAADVT